MAELLNFFILLWSFTCVSGDTSCPRGWIANEGSCYLFAHYPQEYKESKSYCAQHGSNLVEVHDSAENDFLKKHMRELNTKHWWIGANDIDTEGAWEWETSKAAVNYTDWVKGQPSAGANEDCAYFAYNVDYQWADLACTDATHVTPICEKSGFTCQDEVAVIG